MLPLVKYYQHSTCNDLPTSFTDRITQLRSLFRSAPPDPTSFRRVFANRSLDDILHSAHHNVDTVLAAVDRQLRLVDASLNATDLLERGVDVSWQQEMKRAFSVDSKHFMPPRHDNTGHPIDEINDDLEFASIVR
jgi:hypothetical protein